VATITYSIIDYARYFINKEIKYFKSYSFLYIPSLIALNYKIRVYNNIIVFNAIYMTLLFGIFYSKEEK